MGNVPIHESSDDEDGRHVTYYPFQEALAGIISEEGGPLHPSSLVRLPDDCLGEVYKWCPDSQTKCNLRQASRMTHMSPAINSQLGTLKVDDDMDAMAVLMCFPKHAKLKRLHLGYSEPAPFFHRASIAGEECKHKLRSLRELRLVSGAMAAHWHSGPCRMSTCAGSASLHLFQVSSGIMPLCAQSWMSQQTT
jgi:hypothetical protein